MTWVDRFVDTRPLRTSPAYRRLWAAGFLSGIGAQLTTVAVLYEVWELTRNPAAVGAVGVAHAVPTIVFSLVGGWLADGHDRRRVALAATLGQILAVGLLAARAIAGIGSFAVVLALVAAQAGFAALGAPARRTFIPRLLPAEQVPAGVALTHLTFQVSILVGPALGGLVIAAGDVQACYTVDGLTFAGALYAVLRLPSIRPQPSGGAAGTGESAKPGFGRSFWGGIGFVATRPVVGGAFLTDVLATVLAMPVALFPAINEERFGGDPETLGLFLTAIGVGGITAGLASGRVTRTGRPGVVMLVAAGVWGAGLAGAGLAPSAWLLFGCLAIAGAADTLAVISRGAIVQLATPDDYRGRVSAVEQIVGVSGPDVGNFRAGLVGRATSATFALVCGGALCAAGVFGVAVLNRPLRRFTPPRDATERPAETESQDVGDSP